MFLRNVAIVGGLVAAAAVAIRKTDALGLTRYEEPGYEVLQREGAIELRRYNPALVAEVEVSGTSEKSRTEAFFILARYIFGKNRSRSKLAMTAPVLTKAQAEQIAMTAPVLTDESAERMVMTFFMPSRFTMETIPMPLEDRVHLRVERGGSYVAISFSGVLTEQLFLSKRAEAERFARGQGLSVIGNALRAVYNGPWTVPFMRRNEVLIPVDISG